MKLKRSGSFPFLFLMLVSLVCLYCAVPEGPDAPSVKVVSKTSDNNIFDYPIEVSVGVQISIGAAIYLPGNIRGIKIEVAEKGETVFSEAFNNFNEGNHDTVWMSCSFSAAGVKKITITPESDVNLPAVTSSITIIGGSETPVTPKWLFDTIPYSMSTNSHIALELSNLITGTLTENTVFKLQSGSPDNDEVIVSTYEYAASEGDVGTHDVAVVVSDVNENSDMMIIKLTVENVENDVTPPRITLISPSDTNMTFPGDSYTIALLCSDASGVASVEASIGEHSVAGEYLKGFYQIGLSGLENLDVPEIIITAVDSATPPNISRQTIHVFSEDQTFTVTYTAPGDDIGGELPVDNKTYTTGVKVEVAGNTGGLVNGVSTFIGWNTAQDGSGDAYAAGSNLIIGTKDVVLYAQWTSQTTFTITYNGNENTAGDVPVDVNQYIEGASVTVRGNTGNLEKDGATFTGWNTESDGSGTDYVAEETFTIGAENVTLYARWSTSPLFSVTYDGNGSTGGEVPVDDTRYEEGMTITVKDNNGGLSLTGATFTGWNTAADGSGTSYTADATVIMSTSDITLYAQWSTNPTFSVTYNGNGNTTGDVPVDGTGYEEGTTVTVKDNTGNLRNAGFSFVGWNTAEDGSGTPYGADATFPMGTSDVTLYAQWTENPTYTVAYDGNGNTGGTAPVDATNYEEGTEVTVRDQGTLVRTGYTFTGWNTATNGTGTARASDASFEMGSENVTLYAQWSSNPTYTVAYDGNGNTGGTAPVDATNYEEGTDVTVRDQGTLVRTGYIFAGWNTASNGTGTTRAPDVSFEMGTDNVTLYALWTLATYELSVSAETGGTISTPASSPVTVDHGAETTIRATPATGYEFSGWTASGGASIDDPSSASTTVTLTSGDASITANFTRKTYQLTVSTQEGGTITAPANAQTTVQHGVATTITVSPGGGYTFEGWAVTNGVATISNNNSSSTTVTLISGDAKVTANFTRKTYQLTVSAGIGGSISTPSTSPAIVNHGDATAIRASMNTGYLFVNWTVIAGSGATFGSSTSASTTVTLTSQNVSIRANFRANRPTASATATAGSVCAGETVTLTANASGGTAPYTYWWSSSSTSRIVTLTTFGMSGTRPFYCIVTDANGMRDTTNTVSVTINTPPVITAQPQNRSVCSGTEGMLNCTGPSGATYQWYYTNGTIISGAHYSDYWPTITATRSFYCVVTDPTTGCSTESDSATLTVLTPPNNSGLGDRTTSINNPVTLASLASGEAPFTYEWRINGTRVSTSAMYLYTPTATGTYQYTLKVTDDNGCSSTFGPYTITVTP